MRGQGMTGTPLLVGPIEKLALADLAKLAAAHPVDMKGLTKRIESQEGKARHMAQMTAQTVHIPVAYLVTFSIETGHPAASQCRHMSMSVARAGRVPLPQAVWMVAEELGFTGSLQACTVWVEDLQGHGKAINVVQPVKEDADVSVDRRGA